MTLDLKIDRLYSDNYLIHQLLVLIFFQESGLTYMSTSFTGSLPFFTPKGTEDWEGGNLRGTGT